MSMADKLNELKENSGLTLEQIADISNIPLGTVKRLFAGYTENPNIQTIADIVKAVGGSMDEILEISPKEESAESLKSEKTTSMNCNDNPLIRLYQQSINEKNRWIYILFGILIMILIAVFTILIYDLTHPGMGYIKY